MPEAQYANLVRYSNKKALTRHYDLNITQCSYKFPI